MIACGGASAPAQNGGASDGSGSDGGEDAEKGEAASKSESQKASNLPGFELETLDGVDAAWIDRMVADLPDG